MATTTATTTTTTTTTSSSLNIQSLTWPQKPLLLTATKNSDTKIIGIRYVSEEEYIVPSWKIYNEEYYHIPINNGFEEKGKSLVVDFRSNCFVGTMLIRVCDVVPMSIDKNDNNNSKEKDEKETFYFHSRKRTFQTTIQGYFLNNYYLMSSSMTGQVFHPTTNTTTANIEKKSTSFLINSAIKFFKVLSPQLDVKWDTNSIHFLSPLNSTAQSMHVYDKVKGSNDDNAVIMTFNNVLEDWDLEEPSPVHPNSIFNHHAFSNTLSSHQQHSDKSTTQKQQNPRTYRKHLFDALTSQNKKKSNSNDNNNIATTEPFFDTNKIYSFQFYQHLLHLNEYKLEIPIFVTGVSKKFDLSKYLNGQPIKIYAGCGDNNTFWSFDIWHDSLITNDNS